MSSFGHTLTEPPPRRVLIPPCLPLSLRLGGGAPGRAIWNLNGETMGTHWRARLVARPTNRPDDQTTARDVITAALDRVVALMSPWDPASDLARFTSAAPGEWVIMAPETFAVLNRALEIARLTNGAYDPTIGAMTDLLGFGPSDSARRPPFGSTQLQTALATTGFTKLILDADRPAVRQPGHLRLDLCSIAKGYAVDIASDRLHAAGWTDHFLEIGGEARGRGTKPDGQPWWSGLETPPALGENIVALCECAVATSGNTRRRVTTPDGSIGHLVSPHTPLSTSDPLHSVTVIAPTCMEADAWASALYLLGPDEGSAIAESHQLAARFIVPAKATAYREVLTSRFADWQN